MVRFELFVCHCLLALSIAFATLAACDVHAAEAATSSVAIHFSFDRPIDASMASFFPVAKDGRLSEHLNVSFDSAAGSPDAQPAHQLSKTASFRCISRAIPA